MENSNGIMWEIFSVALLEYYLKQYPYVALICNDEDLSKMRLISVIGHATDTYTENSLTEKTLCFGSKSFETIEFINGKPFTYSEPIIEKIKDYPLNGDCLIKGDTNIMHPIVAISEPIPFSEDTEYAIIFLTQDIDNSVILENEGVIKKDA